MPLTVLIAPDKFKGTLTASDAAGAMARGWRRARPGDTLATLPVSDGGDGFGELLGGLLGAQLREVEVVDAAHRPIRAPWWWAAGDRSAWIESARAIGLAQLPARKFHPFELDSFGLGGLLHAAAGADEGRCFVGIGGSATNDAGFGVARALGWQFFNKQGAPIHRWTELHTLASLRPPERPLRVAELVVAVDVQNPLLGSAGCTRIYGPQKGLRPEEFDFSERCLRQLAIVVERQLGISAADEPGAGAAGGLGFGLRCFANARLEPGFKLFAALARLDDRLRAADLVLTGEGVIDGSTAMGKGVGELARMCRELGVPCIGLAGRAESGDSLRELFNQVHALTPEFTTSEEALAQPARWLERLAERAAWRCDVQPRLPVR